MQEVVVEAEPALGKLLDMVEGGEEVVITRGGRPVTRLVRAERTVDRGAARAAAERIRERARALKAGAFDWEEWKAYRDEGRR